MDEAEIESNIMLRNSFVGTLYILQKQNFRHKLYNESLSQNEHIK